MPNSRIQESGVLSFSYSQWDPYKKLTFYAAPYDWLEVSYQYTDLTNRLYSSVFAFSGNQTAKDKGFNFKNMAFEEGDVFPSVSLGMRDVGGTGIFSSEYIVASKRLNLVDLTLGIGWGNLSINKYGNPFSIISDRFKDRDVDVGLGGKFNTQSYFSGETAIFGGLDINLPIRGLNLKIEYDTTNYQTEGLTTGNPFIGKSYIIPDSRINYGLTYKLNNFFELSLSHIKGNTTAFTFAYKLNGEKKYPVQRIKRQEPIIDNVSALQVATSLDDRYLYLAALKYFQENNLSIRSLDVDGDTLSVSYAQNKYISYPNSYGAAIEILDKISPKKIENFKLISRNSIFELSEVNVPRNSWKNYKKLNQYYLLENDLNYGGSYNSGSTHKYKPKINYPKHLYNFLISADTYLGGPDRFLIGGVNLKLKSEIIFSDSITFQTNIDYRLTDTFSALEQGSDSLLPKVRTDLLYYYNEGKDYRLRRSQLNFFKPLSKNIYSKISLGYLEDMFGGIGGEVLYRDFKKNWALGIDLYQVKQRDFDGMFDFKDYSTLTGHTTFYYEIPNTKTLLKISGGRYLAKDSGFTVDFSKRFKSGIRVGGFFSLTDISEEEFGEGSFDKGIYIEIPIQSIFGNFNTEIAGFGLRPTTRDGAAKLYTGFDLWGVTDQGSYYSIKRDIEDYYE